MYIEKQYVDKILACLTKSYKHAGILISSGVKPEHFEELILQNYAKICIKFFREYKSVFTDTSFVSYVQDLASKGSIPKQDLKLYLEKYAYFSNIDLSDANYYVDKVVEWIKQQEYKQLIENALSKYLPQGRITELEKQFEKVKSIGNEGDYHIVDYFENLEERLKRREEGVILGISTGIPQLDDCLYHKGWASKELYIILGAAKMGKTNALLYFTQQAALQQKNVIYFSCEVSANILMDRLDTAFSKVYFDELPYQNETVYDTIKALREQNIGKILVSEHPTKTLTVTKAKHIIERQQDELGIKFDLIVFDYGDIMKPEVTGEKRIGIGDIFERMRGLAGELDTAVLSATQLNREGAKKAVVKETDVAEDWSKIMTADAVIGINASDAERAQNLLRVSIVANRNGKRKSFLIKNDYARMQFFTDFVEFESFE